MHTLSLSRHQQASISHQFERSSRQLSDPRFPLRQNGVCVCTIHSKRLSFFGFYFLAFSDTSTTSDIVTWYIFNVNLLSNHLANQRTCIFNNLKTEFWLPLYFVQNHSLSSISVVFSWSHWFTLRLEGGGRAGSVARLGRCCQIRRVFLPNWTTFYDVQAAVMLTL